MEHRHYVPMRCRHDIPIRSHEDVPLRSRWVFHLRCTPYLVGCTERRRYRMDL